MVIYCNILDHEKAIQSSIYKQQPTIFHKYFYSIIFHVSNDFLVFQT